MFYELAELQDFTEGELRHTARSAAGLWRTIESSSVENRVAAAGALSSNFRVVIQAVNVEVVPSICVEKLICSYSCFIAHADQHKHYLKGYADIDE